MTTPATAMTPRLAATTALYRQTTGGPEFFVVRRDRHLPFLGGFHALPGGSVDAADAQISIANATTPPAFAVAAIRELYEEAGVLVANGAAALTAAQLEDGRKALLEKSCDFATFLRHHGLTLDAAPLLPAGVWVTPPYSRMVFEAQYFAVALPWGQEPSIWPGELDHGEWLSAPAAVLRHRLGELALAYPVLKTLEAFATAPDITATCQTLALRDNRVRMLGAELLAGVHIVPLLSPTLPPATRTNCYILGGRDLIVVDPAPPEPSEQERLLTYLQRLIDDGCTLREVWLSHHHPDHIGAAAQLCDAFGVGIAAHEATAAALATRLPIQRLIHDHDVTELPMLMGPPARWRALFTPGHARGHLCFYEERLQLLLSGDTVVTTGTVVVPPHEGGMRAYLTSLERLLRLPIRFMLPSHGTPIALAHERIRSYLEHRALREQQILQALAAGPRTIEALTVAVYQGLDPRAVRLAEANVAAHLDKLIEDGLVDKKDEHFQATT